MFDAPARDLTLSDGISRRPIEAVSQVFLPARRETFSSSVSCWMSDPSSLSDGSACVSDILQDRARANSGWYCSVIALCRYHWCSMQMNSRRVRGNVGAINMHLDLS